jgi:hypothetical protein
MIFSYNIKKGIAKENILISKSNINLQYQDYQHHKLPITMNPLEYGFLLDQTGNKYIIQINETNIAVIIQEDDSNNIKLFRKGVLRYNYIDKKINENTFVRSIENKQFTFTNNELILFTVEKTVKFMNPLYKLGNKTNKFLVLDIETYLKDGIHVPYAITFYDGNACFSYYITDYKNYEDMIINCIKDIMI